MMDFFVQGQNAVRFFTCMGAERDPLGRPDVVCYTAPSRVAIRSPGSRDSKTVSSASWKG